MISNAITFLLKRRYQSIYLLEKYFNNCSLNINNAIFTNKEIKKMHKHMVKIHNNILRILI